MVTSCGGEDMPSVIGYNGHAMGCMCDRCIIARNKDKIAERAQRSYIERRGAEIGAVSVADALRARSPKRWPRGHG